MRDTRRAPNLLELSSILLPRREEKTMIPVTGEVLQQGHFHYDEGGEEHDELISAFNKNVRGSDPEAFL